MLFVIGWGASVLVPGACLDTASVPGAYWDTASLSNDAEGVN